MLHVVTNLHQGGLERVVADIVRRMDPDRFESHVLCLNYLGHTARGLEAVATLHVAEPMERASMLHPARLTRQIRSIAPDVLHSHSGGWYKASLAGRRAGVRWLVHTDHGRPRPDPWQDRLVDGIAARRTDVVVAVSDALARELRSSLHVPAGRLRCILNGVDTDAFRPRADNGAVRRALGIPAGAPVIGSLGRLFPVKGYDVMIEAFARLAAGNGFPDAHLVIGGDGPESERLATLVRARGLAGRVHLLGWRDDTHDLHSAFTIFTLSSRSEGTSVSLLEAMSAGLPVAVTDVGGNAAVLGPELAAQLSPTEDAERLADAWARLLGDDLARARVGERARQRVLDAYSLGAMVRAYEELYTREERRR